MGCSPSSAVDTTTNAESLFPRKKFSDEYRRGKKLGVGASCSVIECTKKSGGQPYAMKILKKDKSDPNNDNEFLFKNECAVMKKLKHPNIVEFVEAFEDEDDHTYNLVTVLCKGGELFDRVAEGSFSERVASRLARQMIAALAHCHERNVSHRDLKPENFVFETKDPNSNMKLIDFGCAVSAANEEVIKDVAGSPYYVAPEVLITDYRRTGQIWKASDIWSLGVIIFLLVHGYPPFNGETQDQIFHKIRIGKYKFSKDIPLSNAVKDLISKMLVMNPMNRISAADALKHPWIADNAAPDTPISLSVVNGLTDFRTKCRLKKAVAKAIANMMSDEDQKALEIVFKQFDLNGDGQLGPDEIAAMMKHIGRNPADVKELMAEMDENSDGVISKDEFKTMYGMGRLASADDVKKSFEMFDKDGDGFVTHEEIMKMCKNLSPDVAKQLISEVDKNNDGKINFNEWIAAMGELQKGAKMSTVGGASKIKF